MIIDPQNKILCVQIAVVSVLLKHNISTSLRDSADRTVLDVMAELQTPRTREIAKSEAFP